MPRGSEERTDQRKNEIINACEKLYVSKGFQDISIKDISTETTFSRPSIYNYFETKEEIFLALLTREYEAWAKDLRSIGRTGKKEIRETAEGSEAMADELADKIAVTLEKRTVLLKISAMNLYEIEEHSRLERLVEYKKAFRTSMEAFMQCITEGLAGSTQEKRDAIRYAFFPFMYGIYPYTSPTKKQCEAMKEAAVVYQKTSVYEITYRFLRQLFQSN